MHQRPLFNPYLLAMKILVFLCIIICIAITTLASSDEIPYMLLSTPNIDSDPDDNITEISELYALNFNCNVEEIINLGESTNVNQLTAPNVGVVGAIGDSMTAALFAKVKNVFGLLPGFIDKHSLEYRGVSWSIGGDEGVTTLPNLIKNYNPSLRGYSIKTGKEGSANAAYNFAVSGAVASDLLEQATNLVNRVNSDNLNGEWKVITVFIGGNDLCAMCKDENTFSADNFYDHILSAILKLSELDKVYINLVQTVQVSQVSQLTKNFGCQVLQDIMKLFAKCSCIDNPVTEVYHIQYKEKIVALETFARTYLERDDFTVVVQPFFAKTTIPKDNPLDYFAPDCFHLSQLGLLNAAVSLWNNMLEPVGGKIDEFLVGQPIKCFTKEKPYFYTYKNSLSLGSSGVKNAESYEQGSSSGQIAGAVLGTLLAVIVVTGAVIVIGLFAYRRMKPKTFSKYESLSKPSRV